jgi:myosin-5
MARKKFYKIKKSVVIIQRAWRRYVKRRDYMKNKYEWSALKIQKTWKMYQVRKEYKRQIRLIILVQANYRRKKAMREFKLLKIEAKSVGNLQKLNYNLENKVVELSVKLNENLKEHAEFKERASIVETNYINLKDRYMKLESESKSKTGGAIEELAELKKLLTVMNEEKDAALRDLDKNAQMLKKRDDKVQYLTLENTSLKKEVQDLKDHIKSVPKEDPATVAALKKEVASLREQMSRLVAGKYRTDKANEEFLGGNSNGNLSSTAAKAASRYSYALFESAAQVTASVTAQISQQVEAFNKSSDVLNVPQPAAPLFDDDDIESTDRAIRMLGSKDLGIEVVDSLITNLRIPLPSTQTVATRKEIFFPAHLIGYLLSKLLEQNMIGRMRSLSEGVIKATNNLILKFEDDYVSAFWLSNNLELLSVIKSLRDKLPAPTSANQDDEHSASAVLAQIKADLEELLVDIYYGWLKELKKRLVNMVVPAVIENQSLPGYICKQGGGLWGKWASRGTNTEFTIDQLLNFLSKLSKTMRCYYMEDSLSRQALTELLRYTGISAFNHLLMRKNFCTWKRGVQIQYNVSRLEEWCTGHGISEATLHLQQLLQAGKLLTLNKTSPSDIETIFDVCFLLNPSQIKKILGLYYAADFDSPVKKCNSAIIGFAKDGNGAGDIDGAIGHCAA